MTWQTMQHRRNVWRARMRECKFRKEAVEKCMALYDEWMEGAAASTNLEEVVWFQTKAFAAHECAAAVARCEMTSPLVSTDKAIRGKAWSEPITV